MPGRDETGWLIERAIGPAAAPLYWNGAGAEASSWTADHAEAIRFKRKLDGQRASARLMLGATRIVEHAWSCSP